MCTYCQMKGKKLVPFLELAHLKFPVIMFWQGADSLLWQYHGSCQASHTVTLGGWTNWPTLPLRLLLRWLYRNSMPFVQHINHNLKTVEWKCYWSIPCRCSLAISSVLCLFNLVRGQFHLCHVVFWRRLAFYTLDWNHILPMQSPFTRLNKHQSQLIGKG